MNSLFILWVAFGITVLSCELLLKSRKLQAALGRVAVVHTIGMAAAVAVLAPDHRLSAVAILIFWSGAFLSWFGIRSHIESSILLRMIHMLRRGPMTGRELTSLYQSCYGRAHRIEELSRAGLLRSDMERTTMILTHKGSLIAQLVLRLR